MPSIESWELAVRRSHRVDIYCVYLRYIQGTLPCMYLPMYYIEIALLKGTTYYSLEGMSHSLARKYCRNTSPSKQTVQCATARTFSGWPNVASALWENEGIPPVYKQTDNPGLKIVQSSAETVLEEQEASDRKFQVPLIYHNSGACVDIIQVEDD
ncbi:hypothetical protein BGX38DRAFT_1313377 [Terfezia claveryi]|nr:hypothetical protein BGX38DRAFT_1313377 [Terfezia claveryi]